MMPFPDKKYQVIYADPPWSYSRAVQHGAVGKRKAGWHELEEKYSTMCLRAIKELPVSGIADDNSILFLWVTFPHLKDGLDVLKAWGFQYKTLGFSWIKLYRNGTPKFGIGYYTKSNCEVCLLGTKGKAPKVSDKVSSCIISQIEKHSKKPDEARKRIVQFCGDVPRIELFARQRTPGWDVWGNEIPPLRPRLNQ
jgi:site-specific DNA-methyltransferase (adenine-specific)